MESRWGTVRAVSERRPFRTMELTAPGWLAVLVAGSVLGLGLSSLADLSPIIGALIGCGLLLLALVAFDRRRARKQVATVFLAVDAPTVDRILVEARSAGLEVTSGTAPDDPAVVPAGQTAVRCRRGDVGRLLAIVDRHAPSAD